MVQRTDDEARVAAARFASFFRELDEAFVERSDLLRQIALALLAREHVLMTGPPGTAKSKLARSVLDRVVSADTGAPSVFARQFTESTVQTDLVGPIDFKTLMATGRTEHFTDEGMLGAVHGFLDEVFDGRDMLLRSTLNVLHERELKEGTKTTKGSIECALMTTNRYLAEVLDGSRETLLAFVDRIAFVGFVPKGFATGESLRRVLRDQVGGARPRRLERSLTIEDVDLLQDVAARVFVSDAMCERLATLVESFDQGLAAARRADPSFVPTRYLSTRTVVKLGHLLRAACVYDWAVSDGTRPLRVLPRDFQALRLSLVLSGPTPNECAALLATEADPRERRQLEILRTEREIFDRCLASLPAADGDPPPPRVPAALLSKAAGPSALVATEDELVKLAEELAPEAISGKEGAAEAERLLGVVLTELCTRALRRGLGVAPDAADDLSAEVMRLAATADQVDHVGQGRLEVSRWLRGQALTLLHEWLRRRPMLPEVQKRTKKELDLPVLIGMSDERLDELRRAAALRMRLRGGGAIERDREQHERAFAEALERAMTDLASLWDAGLARILPQRLEERPKDDLRGLLGAFDEALRALRRVGSSFDTLGGNGDALVAQVLGRRIGTVVQVAFERLDVRDHSAVPQELGRLLADLSAIGLADALLPADVVRWTAEALGRVPAARPAERPPVGKEGYRALRGRLPRSSHAYTLIDVAVTLGRGRSRDARPDAVIDEVAAAVGELPVALRQALVEGDLARIAGPIQFLEDWWLQTAAALPKDPERALAELSTSEFFAVVRAEAALARFAVELELVARVFPAAPVADTAERARVLDEHVSALVAELERAAADAAWRARGGARR